MTGVREFGFLPCGGGEDEFLVGVGGLDGFLTRGLHADDRDGLRGARMPACLRLRAGARAGNRGCSCSERLGRNRRRSHRGGGGHHGSRHRGAGDGGGAVAGGVDLDLDEIVDAEEVFERLLDGSHETTFDLVFYKRSIGGHDKEPVGDGLRLQACEKGVHHCGAYRVVAFYLVADELPCFIEVA